MLRPGSKTPAVADAFVKTADYNKPFKTQKRNGKTSKKGRKTMKNMKKVIALLLATVMVMAMSISVMAQTVNVGGGDGSITITNAAQGKEYAIYKLFDATQSADGISYKVPEGKTIDTDNKWFSVDAAGNVLAKEGADITTDEFKTWATGFGTQVGEKVTAEDNTVKFDKIPYGYYYVESSLGGTLTVNSTYPNGEVIDKNDTEPVIPSDGAKKIVTAEGTTASTDTAKIGDTVDFQIKFTATNYETKNKETKQITQYTITDTPDALDINTESVVVKVGDKTLTEGTDYTLTGKMTIVIKWADENGKTIYDSPSDVTITYSAKVLKEAADGDASNSAKITFNDKDLPGGDTTVKNYSFTLKKVDGKGTKLDGAKFKLYDAKTGGNEIAVVKDGDGYRVAVEGETGVEIEAGEVVVKGLKGKTSYFLEETKAPEGYNILTERQEVKLGEDNSTVANVTNNAGAELPSTGGIGTTMFYLVGSVLVIGAAVVLISKRRMVR